MQHPMQLRISIELRIFIEVRIFIDPARKLMFSFCFFSPPQIEERDDLIAPLKTSLFVGKDEFGAPFVGEGVQLLHEYLNKCDTHRAAYNREILVVQSSGSGKSRLFTEATKHNLGVLFNVRGTGIASIFCLVFLIYSPYYF